MSSVQRELDAELVDLHEATLRMAQAVAELSISARRAEIADELLELAHGDERP